MTTFNNQCRVTFLAMAMLAATGCMAQENQQTNEPKKWENLLEPESDELMEQIKNMPYIEVGKGISFAPKNKLFKMTLRFRMQNQVTMLFDDDFKLEETQAQVKRLRLRFDGYLYSPKLLYSIQLGFTPYDTKTVPNGNTNIVRDAVICYMPSSTWNISFGQTKVKANRARINSSSALQFVDRSIVNSEFNPDRDFGVFGEYHKTWDREFSLAVKGSVTLGEGRNWGTDKNKGFAYTARLELFPLGRFKSLGEVVEGDFQREQKVRMMLAGAFTYNDRTNRTSGQNGNLMPTGVTRDLQQYYMDFILKYRGFAFYTDLMGRICQNPVVDNENGLFVYTGKGVNVQTSYLFKKNWEVALRNSTLLPDKKVEPLAGYHRYNQSTLAVTKYLIGHNLKVQADASYNHQSKPADGYNRWQLRFVVEAGL